MDFADDVLDRVRAALMAYHAATGKDGRKRSWKAIAGEINDGFLEPPDLAEEDEDGFLDPDKPLAEALRRFVSGAQRPSPERLDGLCLFLKARSYLTDGDLEAGEPDTPLLHALRQMVNGKGQPPLGTGPSRIRGPLAARRSHAGGRTELSILAVSDRDPDSVSIEDRVYLLVTPPQSLAREALARQIKRTGGAVLIHTGFALGWQGQVVAFLRDTLYDDVSIYTVLQTRSYGDARRGSIALIKSGDFGTPADGHPRSRIRMLPKGAHLMSEVAAETLAEKMWYYKSEPDYDGS
jgi:hypothetical protein